MIGGIPHGLPRPGFWASVLLGLVIGATTGCVASQPKATPPSRQDSPVAVDVAVATLGSLRSSLALVGTTEPQQEVVVRSRSEGVLLSLTVDVGDSVTVGEGIGRMDDTLLQPVLAQALAELAGAQAEVSRIDAQIASAQTQVMTAQTTQVQAQVDARRLQSLAQEGAVSTQQAEQAQTQLRAAEGSLQVARAQVTTQTQLRAAAVNRIEAQQALVEQAQRRLTLTTLTAPISGVILGRSSEAGNVLQNNQEILRIGTLNSIKIRVPVSEQQWGLLRLGQTVPVKLDAFPDQMITGQITRLVAAADPSTRLLPIEVTIPNPTGRIGTGLLARITLPSNTLSRVIVPQSAIQDQEGQPQIFLLGQDSLVQARPVTLGANLDGRQEILAGLEPGESFIARSSRPLQAGQKAEPSFLSSPEGNRPRRSPSS